MLVGVMALALVASVDEAFEAATPIARLERWLSERLGDCEGREPLPERRACEAAAARSRQDKRRWALELEDLGGRLGAPTWDAKRRAWRVLLTPVFGAGGLGLTVGRPSRLDGEGRPVVARIPLWLELPAGVPEFVFRRDLERGMVRLHLLFEVGAPWRLARKGNPAVRGISVQLRAWRLESRDGRLGAEVIGK